MMKPFMKPLLVFRSWPRRMRLGLIAGVSIIALIALVLIPSIRLGPHYHDFADKRTIFGIPNALDVFSNVPFFVVGLWGFLWLLGSSSRLSFLDQRERIPYLVFFAGVALTGVGSFWYHLAPSNSRLPWDLLPMTCSFISMVVAIYMERVDVKGGLIALVPLLFLGTLTVVYWYVSESRGHGEYKFYLFLQYFSPVVLALLVGLFPPRYSAVHYLVIAFAFFAAAKLFESFDFQIFNFGHIVSGHSLKHVTAGLSCYWILRMLQVRNVFTGEHTRNDINAYRSQERLTQLR
jgi:hypothetical protein